MLQTYLLNSIFLFKLMKVPPMVPHTYPTQLSPPIPMAHHEITVICSIQIFVVAVVFTTRENIVRYGVGRKVY